MKERQVVLPGGKPGLLDSATSALPLSTHPVCRCSAIMIQKGANSSIYILFLEALLTGFIVTRIMVRYINTVLINYI